MNIKKIMRQPQRMGICGQTCIAMVLDIPLEESLKQFGHNKATNYLEQKKVLERFGYWVGRIKKIDNRKKTILPNFCLIRMAIGDNLNGHLIIHDNGTFYDPNFGAFKSKEELLSKYNYYKNGAEKSRKWRFHTFYEIEKFDELLVAGHENEKRYKVTVSHDLQNTGTRQFIKKIMNTEQLENVRKSDKFKIEEYEVI